MDGRWISTSEQFCATVLRKTRPSNQLKALLLLLSNFQKEILQKQLQQLRFLPFLVVHVGCPLSQAPMPQITDRARRGDFSAASAAKENEFRRRARSSCSNA